MSIEIHDIRNSIQLIGRCEISISQMAVNAFHVNFVFPVSSTRLLPDLTI